MTDIASLSFQIDSSNVPAATDQLNKLSDAADHVRGSVRFLVGAVGDSDQALQQLAASGRASLASFVQISQNLDVITASLNSLRGAAADTIGTLGGQGLSNALTTFQQQFAAMATIFGTTTSALESFNKQAEYLQLNSNQVGSALQRITQAQQNQTPYGQALRSQLDAAGIQVGSDPAAVLRQIQTLFASHQLSQQSFNQLQEFLGPIDPATAAAFRNQPYQTVAARRQEFVGQTLDQQASQTSSTAAALNFQNNYNRAAYNDGRPYLNDIAQNDIGGGARNAFIDDLTRRLSNAAKADPDVIAQQRQLLALLQGAQPGSQNAIAAESQFDILNPTDPLAQSTMSIYGRQALGRAPISGTPSWYERFSDQNFQSANTNYIGAAYDQRRANVGHGGIMGAITGGIQDFALNTDEDTDYILNKFGLYSGPPTGAQAANPLGLPPAPTIGQLAQSPADIAANAQANAALAGQLGPAFGGFQEAFNAQNNIPGLQDASVNSTRFRLNQLLNGQYGQGTGDAIADQQVASQRYIAQNAGTIGFDQLQGVQSQNFLDSQSTGKAIAQAFIEYYKSLGLDPGRLAGLTLGAAINGQVGAGVGLTPAQVDAFKKIIDAIQGDALANIQRSTSQQNAAFMGTQAVLGLGPLAPDQLQALLAGQGAYQDTVKNYGSRAAIAARSTAFAGSVQNSISQTDDGLIGQLFNAQSDLGGAGLNYQQRNAMMAQRMYGGDLQIAQDNGQTLLAQQIKDQIQKYTDLNNKIDATTLAFSDLQSGLSGLYGAQDNLALMNVPPGQRAVVSAELSAARQVQIQGGALGMPATYLNNNPGNLHPADQPGLVGTAPNGVAIFGTPQAGVAANAGQVALNYSRGDDTIAKMISAWNKGPPTAVKSETGNISKMLRVDPNAQFDFGDPEQMADFLKALTASEGTGAAAAFGAGQNAIAGQLLQAQQTGFSATKRGEFYSSNVSPLLRTGQTGAAALAQARFVDPNVPDTEKGALASSQLQQAAENLARATDTLQGQLSVGIQSGQLLAGAALQGPGATQQAQALLQAQAQARINGQDPNGPYAQGLQTQYLAESQGNFSGEFNTQTRQLQQSNQLRGQQLINQDTISNPYQLIVANAAAAQQQQDVLAKSQGASPQDINAADSAAKLAAQFDVLTQKSQEVAQGMSQIGGAVESTLGNLAFSYQQGPGAGLYARKQISGLLGDAGRSLFDTVVGNPIDKFVSGNLGTAVNYILGNTSAAANLNATGGGVSGSGTSATSQTLGGIGGALQGQGTNMLLTDALKGVGGLLGIGGSAGGLFGNFTSGIGNAGIINTAVGGSQIGGAAASSGIFSSLLHGIESFFANGDTFNAGQRIPFANGGVFGRGGPVHAFASGDVFTDPTTMPMALLGEAGPEAIMPLRRGADGKLGLAASGGGGGPSVVVNAPITVGQNALGNNGKMNQQQTQDLQRELSQAVRRAVQGEVAQQTRPGGMVQAQY